MAGYFSYFPKTLYTFDKNTLNQQVVTNIFARSAFIQDIANNAAIFLPYKVKDSDTPEIIAHKIYGDQYRGWIVLLFNALIDPNYDWPLKEEAFNAYVENKYLQTIAVAKTTTHHYELNVNKKVTFNGTVYSEVEENYVITQNEYNHDTGLIQSRTGSPPAADAPATTLSTESVVLTDGKTLTMTTSFKSVSNYTYEFLENEKKREIKLVDPIYVAQIESEFKNLMSNV